MLYGFSLPWGEEKVKLELEMGTLFPCLLIVCEDQKFRQLN